MHSDPAVRMMGQRSSRANSVWSAPPQRPDVLALSGLSLLYRGVMDARRAAYDAGWLNSTRVAVPVISVGNLVVGGTGKTPFTRWLTSLLRERGKRPAVLHGGYGSDEPALHRKWNPAVPVLVGRDRVASAQQAIGNGADVIILDDGFQHLRLRRDLDIVLISADRWHEPQRMLPAGPWREPVDALPASAVVVITRKAAASDAALRVAAEVRQRSGVASIAIANLAIDGIHAVRVESHTASGPVVAVTAIGDPLAFARQLIQLGYDVTEVLAFDDHHDYTGDDLQEIQRISAGRPVITTEKDAVKLDPMTPPFRYWVAKQGLRIEQGDEALMQALNRVIG